MQAIVLSRIDFREYDQIISLYTRERGKVELLARGVKKIVSKNASHLEPGSLVIAESVRGRELEHLTTAQPVVFFHRTRAELEKLLAVRIATAFLDRMTQAGERDANLFRMAVGWLSAVEKTDYVSSMLLDGFFVACLAAFGVAPRLSACVVCDTPFQKIAFEKPALYFAGGGIICQSCRQKKEAVGEDMRECMLADVSNLQLLLKADWRLLEHYPIAPAEAARLHALVYAFTIYHSERELADWGNMWYSTAGMKQTMGNNNNNNTL